MKVYSEAFIFFLKFCPVVGIKSIKICIFMVFQMKTFHSFSVNYYFWSAEKVYCVSMIDELYGGKR